MPWQYAQSTGALSHNGALIATGYAGHGDGVNNPDAQDEHNVGPIPRGTYRIGPLEPHHDHLGPDVLGLTPDPGNQMFGRSGFFIHGDNAQLNRSASDGCIILGHDTRLRIADSGDHELVVVA